MWWADLGQQLSTHAVTWSLPQQHGEEQQKWEKPVGRDKDGLISEGKKSPAPSDAKAVTHHLPPADCFPASLQATATFKRPMLVILLSILSYSMG